MNGMDRKYKSELKSKEKLMNIELSTSSIRSQELELESNRFVNDKSISLLDEKSVIEKKEKNNFWGIIFMTLCGICNAVVYIWCKLSFKYNKELTGLDYWLYRSPIVLMIGTLQLLHAKSSPLNIPKNWRWLLLLRTISGGIGIPFTFIALRYLPSSKVTLIISFHPLLVAVFAFYLLSEILTKIDVGSLMGAFIGIILFWQQSSATSNTDNSTEYIFGLSAAIIASLSALVVALCLRVINQHLHPAISPFYLSLITSIEMVILYLISPNLFHIHSFTGLDFILFTISGCFEYLCQLFKSISYKYGDASVVTPYVYFQMVFLLLSDVIIFEYVFTIYDITGGLLIITSLLTPILFKQISKS